MYGIDHREFDAMVRKLQRCLELYPDQDNWADLVLVVDREVAGR